MRHTATRAETLVLGCVAALCVVVCVLIFLLPAGSLVVDLVYQGF